MIKPIRCGDCRGLIDHENLRPGKWSPYFCEECDEKRIARIDKAFGQIADRKEDDRGE